MKPSAFVFILLTHLIAYYVQRKQFFPVNASTFDTPCVHQTGLYFQTMESEDHGLTRSVVKNVKESYRHPHSDSHLVLKTLWVPIQARTLYVVQDLHKIPHGTDLSSNLNFHERNGDGVATVPSNVHRKEEKLNLCRAFGPRSHYIDQLQVFADDFPDFLEFVIKHGTSRDGVDHKRGNFRIMQNYAQPATGDGSPQPPTQRFPFTCGKNQKLGFSEKHKTIMAAVMNVSMECVREEYPEKMQDVNRNKLFGNTFFKGVTGKKPPFDFSFEMLDIMACKARINRHMDYMNDVMDYNLCVSYSALVERNQEVWRLVFILAAREQVRTYLRKVEEQKKRRRIRISFPKTG